MKLIYFLQGYLNDNLSDTPSEIKDVVDCFDDSGDDSLNSTDSKIIRSGEKNKVVMSSSDYNTDEVDKGMIPWREHLKFHMYNPTKRTNVTF